MKKITLLLLMQISMGLILVACGPSQAELDATTTQIAANIFATQTAEVPPTPTPTATSTITPTPTPSPTLTPSPTPTPTPRPLSDAVLTLDDLPPDFEEEPLDDYDLEPGKGSAFVVQVNESGFVFSIDTEVFQIIAGQTELLTDRTDQAEWDGFVLDFSEIFLSLIAQLISGEDAQNLEEIPDLDDIGETSSGFTAIIGGIPPLRMDVVFFRREKLGALIYTFYYDGDTPIMQIDDAARKLDGRIIEILP